MGMSCLRARIVKLARWCAPSTSLDYSTKAVCGIRRAGGSLTPRDIKIFLFPPMYLAVYQILFIAVMAVLLEVGLATWTGKRLAQIARRTEEVKSEPALDSLSRKYLQ